MAIVGHMPSEAQAWRKSSTGARLMGGLLACGMLMAAATVMMSAPTSALAASAGSPLEGFATDPKQPVEIEADRLEVDDKNKTAVFIGNVLAVQGATRLRSDRLKATYSAGPDGGRNQVRQIVATGRVHVLSKDDQSADGDWARYDVIGRTIIMGDKVVLRQGQNVIRGKKLTIDLNSGRSRVTGGVSSTTAQESGQESGNGRVKALFQPSQAPKK
ncbi:MAG: lipopolysaccharide transport periplasmic protein LptA [Parvibaculum sp.]